MKTIYLDNCCLNRPFDDQSQPRIRLESEAVIMILSLVQKGWFDLVTSDASVAENLRCRDVERRRWVGNLLKLSTRKVKLTPSAIAIADNFLSLGFGTFDAFHLAFAEKAGVDVLLTVDDQFLRLAKHCKRGITALVINPVAWLQEREFSHE